MSCYTRNEQTGFAQQDIFCSATLLGGGTVSGCSHSANTSSAPSSYASYAMTGLYCSMKALTEFLLNLCMKTSPNLAHDAHSEGLRFEAG